MCSREYAGVRHICVRVPATPCICVRAPVCACGVSPQRLSMFVYLRVCVCVWMCGGECMCALYTVAYSSSTSRSMYGFSATCRFPACFGMCSIHSHSGEGSHLFYSVNLRISEPFSNFTTRKNSTLLKWCGERPRGGHKGGIPSFYNRALGEASLYWCV